MNNETQRPTTNDPEVLESLRQVVETLTLLGPDYRYDFKYQNYEPSKRPPFLISPPSTTHPASENLFADDLE